MTTIQELQRQLSEMAERIASLEVGFLRMADLAERTTNILESLVEVQKGNCCRHERNTSQNYREPNTGVAESSRRLTPALRGLDWGKK